MNTCVSLVIAISKRIRSYTEVATQQYDSYAWQVQCAPKETPLLPLLYKLAMPDDRFIFSSSPLPRPRFELRTLAGYNIYTGLFEMIVGILTTCHTQYTSDSSVCIFLFNRTTLQFLLHTLQVLCMCTLCDSTNINTIIKFVPNCLQHVSGDGFNGGSDSYLQFRDTCLKRKNINLILDVTP